jgi:hypothetical protein
LQAATISAEPADSSGDSLPGRALSSARTSFAMLAGSWRSARMTTFAENMVSGRTQLTVRPAPANSSLTWSAA